MKGPATQAHRDLWQKRLLQRLSAGLSECQQCKSKGKWIGIRVIGNEFVTYPCTFDQHPECSSIKTAHSLVDRAVQEFNRGVQAHTSYARKTPEPV
ncbi:hypothetical protein Aduo_001250 [Ancylostoma duodenale]